MFPRRCFYAGNGRKKFKITLPLPSAQKSSKVKSVKLMKNGDPLKYKVVEGKLIVTLPETPEDIDYVIEVEFAL